MKRKITKVISLTLCLCMLVTAFCSFSASAADYEREFRNYLRNSGYASNYGENDEGWYFYGDIYSYYGENSESTEPLWILANGGMMYLSPAPCYGIFGDYIVRSGNYFYPYPLRYYILIPTDDTVQIITLRQAYNAGLEGIEKVFTEAGIGDQLGDANQDGKLDILDATFIQKCLTQQESFLTDDGIIDFENVTGKEKLSYISDINKDGERNIMDVTCIQRKLAKLDF